MAALLLLCGLLLLADVRATNFTNRVADSVIFAYPLRDGQAHVDSLFTADTSPLSSPGRVGLLRRDPRTTDWIPERQGMRFKQTNVSIGEKLVSVDSLGNVSALLDTLNAVTTTTGWTLELWLEFDEPGATFDTDHVIMGFNRWDLKLANTGGCTSTYDGMAVVRRQDQIFFLGTSCSAATVAITTGFNAGPYHIVLAYNAGGFIASYFNYDAERKIFGSASDVDYSRWQTNYRLQMAPLNIDNQTWAGKLFFVGMHNRTLTDAEVRQNFEAGPPPSLPFPTATAATALEDTPSNFSLTAATIDGSDCSLVVVTVPDKGTLFYHNNSVLTPIAASNVPLVVSPSNSTTLVYLSPLHQFGSFFTSFVYKATNEFGDSRVQTLFISVSPTNDAPVPVNVSQQVFEKVPTVITLAGTDVDGDNLGDGYIVASPARGALYQWVSGGTGGVPVVFGDLINITAGAPNPVKLNNTFRRVVYVSEIAEVTPERRNELFTDAFLFMVSDAVVTPLNSSIGRVSLAIVNSLQAVSGTSTGDEDTRFPVYLTGLDALAGGITYFITTLPSKGFLYQTSTSPASIVGTELPAQVLSSNGTLFYQPLPNEFGPNHDEFLFYARTADGRLSADAKQTLNVLPENDPFVISVSSGSLSTVVNANPDTQATLFSVTIQDTADDPNDIFLVELYTDDPFSFISLDFNSIAPLSFQQGDGISDSRLLFTGTRTACNAAMNNMEYTNVQLGDDVVHIKITDSNYGTTIVRTATINADTLQNPETQRPAESTSGAFLFLAWIPVMTCPFCCLMVYIVRSYRSYMRRHGRNVVDCPDWMGCLCADGYMDYKDDEADAGGVELASI